MAGYVDGFVVPVPKKHLKEYRKMATVMGKLCRKFGATQYMECMADDVKRGKVTSFPQSVKLKAGETVFFSWITYKSRSQRDRIMQKVMDHPDMAAMMKDGMCFDGMRMFWGGFKPFVKM